MERTAKHTISIKPGEYIAPGGKIELTKEQEKTLEADGALEDKDTRKRAAAAGPAKPAGAKLTAAIAAAIVTVDPAVEEAWTAAGKPSTLALALALGYEVTAAERDAALAEIQKKGTDLGV